MSVALIGRKAGMTRIFTDAGETVPVTVIEVLPNRITQVKSVDKDGYRAIQVSFGKKRPQLLSKAAAGHYAKANVEPGKSLVEFRLTEKEGTDLAVGAELKATIFAAGAIVDAVATATAGTPRIALRPLAATTATAAALTIVDQRMSSTSPKNLSVPAPSSSFSNSVGCAAWGSRASRAGSRHLPARPGHNRVLAVGMGGPFRTAVRR